MPRILVIGGSDSSGGAGVFADLKTCHDLESEACAAITAVTAQSNHRQYHSHAMPAPTLRSQLHSVSPDEIDAIKIGMLPNLESIEVVGEFLEGFPSNRVVLDPVFSSSSGGSLSTVEGVAALDESLFHLVGLITPNLFEAERLIGQAGLEVASQTELALACLRLGSPAVLLKGGHYSGEECTDLLALDGGETFVFSRKRIPGGSQVRGTGCRLATAITCLLASERELREAVGEACRYLTAYIESKVEDSG